MKYVRWIFLVAFFGSGIALLIWGPRAVDKHYVIGAQFEEAGYYDGVKVVKVEEKSPAERAGLKPGDVIRKVDGHDTSNLTAFFAEVNPHPAGPDVVFEAQRPAARAAATTPEAVGNGPMESLKLNVTMEDAKDRVIVHYWEKWSGTEADQMRQIVNQFNTTVGVKENIYVQYMSMSQVDRKTLVSTAAGAPPEIAGLWQDQVAQWAALDALEPLDERAAKYGIKEGYYKQVYWDACHYKGHLVGLISTPATIMLHYNKELFRAKAKELTAAGLDPERAPRTLDEMQAYAKILTTRDAKGKLQVAGFIPSEPGWWRTRTPLWWGAHLYNSETDKFDFTSKECIAAFSWWASFSDADHLGFDAISEFSSSFGNFASAENPFLSGKVAMTLQGPWMVNFIQMNKPEWNNPAVKGLKPDSPEFRQKMREYMKLPVEERQKLAGWGVAPFPSVYSDEIVKKYKGDDKKIQQELVNHGVAFCDFDVLVIPKGAPHQKEAFRFIAYLQQQDVMETICALHGKPTPLAAPARPEWLARHPNPYIDQFDAIARSEHSQAQPKVAVWPEAEEALGAAVDRIVRLDGSPQKNLAEAQARAQPKLDYFRELERKRGIK